MSYNTNQKTIILNFLKNNKDKCFKLNEIYDFLKNDNKISFTTIYRYLNNLEKDNVVKKYTDNKEAMYQYVDTDKCRNHMHLKCIKCNNIIHLDCNEAIDLKNHIKEQHEFMLDTTIFGVCKECFKNEN